MICSLQHISATFQALTAACRTPFPRLARLYRHDTVQLLVNRLAVKLLLSFSVQSASGQHILKDRDYQKRSARPLQGLKHRHYKHNQSSLLPLSKHTSTRHINTPTATPLAVTSICQVATEHSRQADGTIRKLGTSSRAGIKSPGREADNSLRTVPRLKMNGVTFLPPPYTFMACTGTVLPSPTRYGIYQWKRC